MSLDALAVMLALVVAAPPGPRPGERAPRPREAEERPAERRRAPLPSPPGPSLPLDVEEQPLVLDLRQRSAVCKPRGWSTLRKRLLALENTSQLTSLELWGDKEIYGFGDPVLFHMRAPRGVYVTLWWLGPDDNIIVVLENVRIPAERNITVDTGGIIVPPFGTETWVAVATLEPLPVGCRSEAAMIQNLERRLAVEHGVGRWEVTSR